MEARQAAKEQSIINPKHGDKMPPSKWRKAKMIKLQMHQMTLDGKPLPETGKVVSGNDAGEVIEAMKFQSPFTADMTEREYIDNILSKIMPSEKVVELDATEFLTKLAKGFLSFLPEEDFVTASDGRFRSNRAVWSDQYAGCSRGGRNSRKYRRTRSCRLDESSKRLCWNVLNGRSSSETTEGKPCADKQV